ncbi:NOL1/NOP2/sun family-domain-containing protein [Xylaria acuta]|nr:NOL1/NOP2/sun family-domain-containing protein [Xylaria acuta]
MGTGNRFKHQGIPEPLSEAHIARLKRKAGLPIDDIPETKKRKAQNGKASSKTNNNASGKVNRKSNETKEAQPLPSRNGKAAKPKSKKAKPEPELDLDDMSDGVGGGFSDEDMSGLDEEGGLADDFLGSDDSVYDSEGEGERRAMFSEDEDDSDGDAEEKLTAANIVGLSRKLDKEKAEEEAAAEAELQETLQTNIDVPHVLEDGDEEQQNKNLLAPDLQLLRQRISDTIRVLDDFANLSEPDASRSEYTAQLLKDICAYYGKRLPVPFELQGALGSELMLGPTGYSEFLAEKLLNLFPPREALAFFDANETPRPIVIRTNTLKTSRRELASALINRGVTLEPVGKWSKVGLQIFESNVPLGATPEYLAGHYIMQAASSFLPCMALAPQEGERILDMASAPGGKTTYLAALMKNTGCIFANDPSKTRSRGLIGNVHRLGVRNVIVCNYDARDFPKVMGGFDRVLLVIAKDPSVKTNKTEKDFITIPHTQKQLLLGAIDSVNHAGTGGYIVYSTCSVSVEENEMVVQYALKKRPNVRLVSTELPFGKEGFTAYQGKTFDKSLSLTRRFYPHTLNLDGFYVAKFHKIGPTLANLVKDKAESTPRQEEVIDRTPILADGKISQAVEGDDFGGFDDDEDAEYIQRAKRNAMRKRGLDPKALDKPKTQDEAKSESPQTKTKAKPANGGKQKTKRVFNPKSAKLENGQVKCGEHSLGSIRSNQETCELCSLIDRASRFLKPWWPIAEFLDRPERITCALFNGRNRLGSGVLTGSISQTQVLLDQLFVELNPSYSSVNLIKQEFLDSLRERGAFLDRPESTTGGPRKNNSLNILLILAGLAPVKATSQIFIQLHPCLYPVPTVEDYVDDTSPPMVFPTGRIVRPEVNV